MSFIRRVVSKLRGDAHWHDRFQRLEFVMRAEPERQRLLIGALLARDVAKVGAVASLSEVEFSVFSQFGDDGIIQWLVHSLEFPNKTFIEFGVTDYRESNTRFLLMHSNWSGLVMDDSEEMVSAIIGSEYFWKYELSAKAAWIDADNINGLIAEEHLAKDVGVLHIDLDGNDYWIWRALDVVSPILVILEYNSVFGVDRAITVPYDRAFSRESHYSGLYWGASLGALQRASARKDYAFIGCNSAGNNAYFVRRDSLNETVREIALEDGYVASAFREGRDTEGRLTFATGDDRVEAIRGMPVYNLDTDHIEEL